MQVHVLASSSSGNAAVVELAGHRFLIDAGISCAALEHGLWCCGLKPADLSAVFITHEHQDHIKGLETFIRRSRLPVFTRRATWEKLACRELLPPGCVREITGSLVLEGVTVETFSTSHDAVDPVGFSFHGDGQTFVLATDFGIATSEIENAVREADCMILESNHDPELLRTGPYPAFLKKRILSAKGHLSNPDAGKLLAENCMGKPREVFLAHLSQENNRIELAQGCVGSILKEAGYRPNQDVTLFKTYPDRISRLKPQNPRG